MHIDDESEILYHCSNSEAQNLFWSGTSQDIQHTTLGYNNEGETWKIKKCIKLGQD